MGLDAHVAWGALRSGGDVVELELTVRGKVDEAGGARRYDTRRRKRDVTVLRDHHIFHQRGAVDDVDVDRRESDCRDLGRQGLAPFQRDRFSVGADACDRVIAEVRAAVAEPGADRAEARAIAVRIVGRRRLDVDAAVRLVAQSRPVSSVQKRNRAGVARVAEEHRLTGDGIGRRQRAQVGRCEIQHHRRDENRLVHLGRHL